MDSQPNKEGDTNPNENRNEQQTNTNMDDLPPEAIAGGFFNKEDWEKGL